MILLSPSEGSVTLNNKEHSRVLELLIFYSSTGSEILSKGAVHNDGVPRLLPVPLWGDDRDRCLASPSSAFNMQTFAFVLWSGRRYKETSSLFIFRDEAFMEDLDKCLLFLSTAQSDPAGEYCSCSDQVFRQVPRLMGWRFPAFQQEKKPDVDIR